VAAPLSTFDLSHTEEEITVEEREADEICFVGDVRLAPEGIDVYNPAFDATPLELVSALITEKGVFKPPLMPPL
jgi:methylthioribose-1-phosphate isomerase